MAVVSQDHADESYYAGSCLPSPSASSSPKRAIRYFSPEDVDRHNRGDGDDGPAVSYWAVVDGFVVDASDFLAKHPSGRKKLLATNDPETGDAGRPFDFSFSRGRNAHFPATARTFQDGVERFLNGGSAEIVFPATYKDQEGGKLVVLGRLRN